MTVSLCVTTLLLFTSFFLFWLICLFARDSTHGMLKISGKLSPLNLKFYKGFPIEKFSTQRRKYKVVLSHSPNCLFRTFRMVTMPYFIERTLNYDQKSTCKTDISARITACTCESKTDMQDSKYSIQMKQAQILLISHLNINKNWKNQKVYISQKFIILTLMPIC